METERKDETFLCLRDHFSSTRLAEHLKENGDFARVGEKERDGGVWKKWKAKKWKKNIWQTPKLYEDLLQSPTPVSK